MHEQATAFLAAFGPLSHGMAWHIALMNAFAPLAAVLLAKAGRPRRTSSRGMLAATIVQLLLLWGWHAPPAWAAAAASPALHVAMQASLVAVAVWFWSGIVLATGTQPWRAVFCLLLTSKLFCLLGVLLIFARRALYEPTGHHGAVSSAPLADQHLAGLMMVIVCPLTYLLAAVVVTARGIGMLDFARSTEKGPRLA